MKLKPLAIVVSALCLFAGCASDKDQGTVASRISGRAGVQVTSRNTSRLTHTPPGPATPPSNN